MSGSEITARAGEAASNDLVNNFVAFDRQVRLAEQYYERGDLHLSALRIVLAAHFAASRHCGIFASPRLERLLHGIGSKVPFTPKSAATLRPNGSRERVLHVCTEVYPIGGVTRMIARWIAADGERTSSVALTQQRGPIPESFSGALEKSGVTIHRLNDRVGGLFDWVQSLRALAREHDYVVLHVHCEDIIPLIAFAEPSDFPPVILLNHADHLFWLGPGVSHLVASLRDAAEEIVLARRGVEQRRSFLLPTVVEPTVRLRSRAEAKRELGIPEDRIVLVSVARGAKYRTLGDVSFADRHVPVLRKHPEATLIVVGVGDPADWNRARAAVDGRIISLPEMPDPRIYFEAADIYLDSYPFPSSTSMLEAVGYGLPPVTLFAIPDAARIIGINHIGLLGSVTQARSDAEYTEAVSTLIADADLREKKGRHAREVAERTITAPGWCEHLEKMYERARELPPLDPTPIHNNTAIERPYLGEPDCRHASIYGSNVSLPEITKVHMGMLSARSRLACWNELRQAGAFRSSAESAKALLPEWLKRKIKDRLR